MADSSDSRSKQRVQHPKSSPQNLRSSSRNASSRNSPASPYSDFKIASPIPHDNAVYGYGRRSTTPESEVESSLAYDGTEIYHNVKRKRKFRKKKDRSRSNINLIKNVNNESTGESDAEVITDKNLNLQIADMVISEHTESEQKSSNMQGIVHPSGEQIVKSKNEREIVDLNNNESRNKIEIADPSCTLFDVPIVDIKNVVSADPSCTSIDIPMVDIKKVESGNNIETVGRSCPLVEVPVVDKKTIGSVNEIEVDVNPGCSFNFSSTVDLKQKKFVSIGVQTDWSWLRDKNNDATNDGPIEQPIEDMKDVLESLKFGLYGGFGIPEVLQLERMTNDVEASTQEYEYKKTTAVKPLKQITSKQINSNLNVEKRRVTKSASKTKQEHKKHRKVKSAKVRGRGGDSSDSDNVGHNSRLQSLNNQIKTTGPPEILKYHREKSEIKKKKTSQITETKQSLELPKCSPEPPVSGSLFSGLCQFCGKTIVDLATTSQLNQYNISEQLYCCPEYEHFIKLHFASLEQEAEVEDEVIDITPHAPYGSKVSRKAARDRVVERVRERELERQRAAAQQANMFSFARQMKTIQFTLTSIKCMNEGWTVRPVTPPPEEPPVEDDIFKIEVNSTLLQKAAILNEKYYDGGQKFLTIFPDGTGCCYYPNGNVAVLITSTEPEKYTYICQTNQNYDDLEDSGILAIFEPNGNGICHYQKRRKLKLFMNAHGGIELDKNGQKRKRWQWYFVKGRTLTPPFQPICFSLNRNLSVRLLDQDNIALIFSANKRSVRFNVGANITSLKIHGHGQFEVDESEKYLAYKKKRISTALTQLHDTLRLPKSTRFDRIYPSRSTKKSKDKLSPLPPIDRDGPVYVN